eukprot:TRINITY_DN14017_c0_g1_i11.p1 TRINITY_DN14017_c0_g1~~TRINITY_DN14017_c0_g1_i11.p1  ORF type:complete len:380 (+),score=46.65 TRINITY_DN14017_c0_g1_i11:90-1229(+)
MINLQLAPQTHRYCCYYNRLFQVIYPKMDEFQIEGYVRLVSNKRVLQVAADFLINGKLTKAQFMRTFQAPRHVVDNLFALYDDDGNGVLDNKEFLMAMQDLDSGKAHATCDICTQLMWKWYECEVCLENFQICSRCYSSSHGHPHNFIFVKNYKDRECAGFPPHIGLFLAKEMNSFMQEYDFDRSGTISVSEFLSIVPYATCAARKVIQRLFGQNGGELSKSQFLSAMCILEASRSCTECKHDFDLDNLQALSCTNKNCKYDICKKCIKSGKCTHSCPFFECAGPFKLTDLGMGLDNEGQFQVDDFNIWSKYQPFFEKYLLTHYESIIFENPNSVNFPKSGFFKNKKRMSQEAANKLELVFDKKAVKFDFQKFITALNK